METGNLFSTDRTLAIRLPAGARFPDFMKKIQVRGAGKERVIALVDAARDSIFLGDRAVIAPYSEAIVFVVLWSFWRAQDGTTVL